jgi:hypothetical protein
MCETNAVMHVKYVGFPSPSLGLKMKFTIENWLTFKHNLNIKFLVC